MDFVETSIFTHVLTIFLLLGVMVFNYNSISKSTNYLALAKQLRFMTPFYHFLNACTAYTGMIVAAYSHDLSVTVILMSITTIFLMVLEIKRYKKMRVIRSTDIDKQEEFKIFAKKIYTMEISALVFTFVVSKIF
ncbi:MAG: hypothetical protein KAQ94_04860 [Arcobacteraceae bacterium]|nr:hypothetical protein [Arcobacteraceae bacterium]